MPRPDLVDVLCPDCSRSNATAVIMRVPASLNLSRPMPMENVGPRDEVHACAKCPSPLCRVKIWCVIVLRPAA